MRTASTQTKYPAAEINGTRRVVAAIAEELHRLYGRNGRLDEAGVEGHLGFIVSQARKEAANRGAFGIDAAMPPAREPKRGRVAPRGRRVSAPAVPEERVETVRRQIAEGSYESEERLEAAINGLADELGI